MINQEKILQKLAKKLYSLCIPIDEKIERRTNRKCLKMLKNNFQKAQIFHKYIIYICRCVNILLFRKIQNKVTYHCIYTTLTILKSVHLRGMWVRRKSKILCIVFEIFL